ncbi:hypothetical protein T439DRAFT_163522 [Meredithblackwellia eburnea MCA 4105]
MQGVQEHLIGQPVASTSGGEKGEKVKGKRGPKACVQCRKLKRTCEGGEPPCARCKASGAECVYEKPASSVVYDSGLTRLASIEASLALQERRFDTLAETLGSMTVLLTEMNARLRAFGGIASASPRNSGPTQQFVSSPLASSTVVPPKGPLASLSDSFNIAPASSHPRAPSATSPASSTTREKGGVATAKDSATPAISNNGGSPTVDISKFVERMGQPMEALAEASKGIVDEEVVKAEERQRIHELRRVQELPQSSAGDDQKGKRGQKRQRTEGGPRRITSSSELDLVSKGLLDDTEARQLILLWTKEILTFCPVLDANFDTYESLRQRSPLLFNTIIHVTYRLSHSSSPSSSSSSHKSRALAADEARRLAQNVAFETSPPALESVQALLILSCFHAEPYTLTGLAVRMAHAARYETCWERLERHGWHQTDDTARRLTAQARAYLYAVFLDFKHSRYTGRVIPLRQEDMDRLQQNIDRFLTLPLILPNDHRHVANFHYIAIERRIIEDSKRLELDPLEHQLAYVSKTVEELRSLYGKYDASASEHFAELSYPRRSHLRIFYDAKLYLLTNIYKQRLFDPDSVTAEVVKETMESAHSALKVVLQSPTYTSNARWSGYLLRVDLSFAAIVLLKLVSVYPYLTDDLDEVTSDVLKVAKLLEGCSGSMKQATMLRLAHDQVVLKTRPPSPSHQLPLVESIAIPDDHFWGTSSLAFHFPNLDEPESQLPDTNNHPVQPSFPSPSAQNERPDQDWLGAVIDPSFLDSSDLLLNHDWTAMLNASNDGSMDWTGFQT